MPENPTTMVLSFFPTAEGFYDFKNKKYIYQYKDHLGNARLSYSKNSAGVLEILDRNDYYPFGMNLGAGAVYDPKGSPLNYKFGSKELQETGFYDFGARFYMSDIAIFGTHDPLSEKTLQPYAYAYNNPIFYIDPTGMEGESSNNDSSESGSGDGSAEGSGFGGSPGGGDCPPNCNGGSGKQIVPASFGNLPGGHNGPPREIEGAGENDVRAEQDIEGINLNGKYGKGNSGSLPSTGILPGGGGGIKKTSNTNTGSFWNFSANFAFGGGIGFSIGQVTDSNNETDWFFSLNGNLGLSAGAGFESGIVTPTDSGHKFINSDFAGEGRAISGGEGSVSGTYGGTFNRSYDGYKNTDQFDMGNFGRNSQTTKNGYTTSSIGIGKGVKGGLPIMWSASKTWVHGK